MMILKICAAALTAAILIGLIRTYKPEFTAEAVLAASMILLFQIIGSIRYSFSELEQLYYQLSYGKTYFPIVLKALGIAYITDFTAALCQDAGEKAIAAKVELAGKVAIFLLALPVFTSLLEMLNQLL